MNQAFQMPVEVMKGSCKAKRSRQLTLDESEKEVRAKIFMATSHMDQAEL